MSEELKCPLCGSAMEETYLGYVCFNTNLENPCSFRISKNRFPRITAAMESEKRHRALVEAVAWERECCQDIRPLVAWADLYARHGEDYVDVVAEDLRAIQDAARAEVDRLIAEGEG